LATPPQPALPGQLSAAPPIPAERPHDFAQLVDRLVAAREAVMPQPVALAIDHAEFGPVRLAFRHDDAGLSVALSSPDPDFARAVTAASLPAAPTEAAPQTAAQARSDQSSSSDTTSQSRGQSAERREERQQARHQPSAPQSGPGANPGANSDLRRPGRGILA
jgi:hypothetical protein